MALWFRSRVKVRKALAFDLWWNMRFLVVILRNRPLMQRRGSARNA